MMPEEVGVTNGELARSLTRIEGKLDRVTDDFEQRLRRVERFVWMAVGLSAAGALSGIGSAIAGMSGTP